MGCDLSFINKFAEKHKGDTIRGDDGKMYLDKKILLLGLDNAGKTSILIQYKENQFSNTVPTIGLNVEQIPYQNKYMLTMWDVGGQATKLWKHYFDSIDSIMFVLDASQAIEEGIGKPLQKSKQELHKLISDPALDKCAIVLMLNKVDLVDNYVMESINKEDKGLDQNSIQMKIDEKRLEVRKKIAEYIDVETLINGKQDIFSEVKENIDRYAKIDPRKRREVRVQLCSAKTQEGIWEGLKHCADVFEEQIRLNNIKEGIKTDIENPNKNFTGRTEENKLQNSEIIFAAQNAHNRSSCVVMKNTASFASSNKKQMKQIEKNEYIGPKSFIPKDKENSTMAAQQTIGSNVQTTKSTNQDSTKVQTTVQ